jgi:hypothetical protein
MKFIYAIGLLFASLAMAAPAIDETKHTLEARACRAGCSCLSGYCNCAQCGPTGCDWFPEGPC